MLRQTFLHGFESFDMGNHAFPMKIKGLCLDYQQVGVTECHSKCFEESSFWPNLRPMILSYSIRNHKWFSSIYFPWKYLEHPSSWLLSLSPPLPKYLVGGLEHFLFFLTLGIIIPTDELHHFSEGWLNHQPDIHTVYTYLFHPWHLRHAGFAHGMPRHRHPIGWPHWSGGPASWKSTRGQSPATHGHSSCEDQCWAFGGERHVPAPKQDCKEQNMDHNL